MAPFLVLQSQCLLAESLKKGAHRSWKNEKMCRPEYVQILLINYYIKDFISLNCRMTILLHGRQKCAQLVSKVQPGTVENLQKPKFVSEVKK